MHSKIRKHKSNLPIPAKSATDSNPKTLRSLDAALAESRESAYRPSNPNWQFKEAGLRNLDSIEACLSPTPSLNRTFQNFVTTVENLLLK
ncbi:MAG: hypothetical protein BVN35_13805 [Proteobacteria bacterium ST_bin11]|nr:MAG: hypothetical protein BVN35_13805 [Proteobacteria bacterium ST_bin11]